MTLRPLPSRAVRAMFPALSLASMLGLAACGSDDKETVERERELQAYKALADVATAPAGVRKAAASVVRLEILNGTGTGFFAKVPSLGGRVALVTNFHVVGASNCALEGCYVNVVTGSEKGSRGTRERRWLKPAGASSNLDVAFYDVFPSKSDAGDPSKAVRLSTSLSLSASAKVTETVYTVGHPFGGLKKVSVGRVFRNDATSSESTAFAMPGSSGSPILDEAGNLVGIMFAKLAGEGRFSSSRIVETSFFARASDAATKVDSAPETLAGLYPDAKAELAIEDLVANTVVYRASETAPKVKGADANAHVADLLGAACDTRLGALNLSDARTTDGAASACWAALDFVDCRPLEPQGREVTGKCPEGAEKDAWRKRIEGAATRLVGARGLDPVGFVANVAILETDTDLGRKEGLAAMERRLAAAPAGLDFSLATRLLAYSGNGSYSYRGKRLSDYVRGYSKVTGYEMSLESVYRAHEVLLGAKVLLPPQFLEAANAIYNDPGLTLASKIRLERRLNDAGYLDRVERGY